MSRQTTGSVLEQLESRQLLTVSFQTIADLEQGQIAGSAPNDFVFGDQLAYFSAETVATGRELWRTDGTNSGTILLRDIVAGPESPMIDRVTTVGDIVYFRTRSPFGDNPQLWRSDGTSGGTQLVSLAPGTGLLESPDNITAGLGCIYFSAVHQNVKQLYRLNVAEDSVPVPLSIPDPQAFPYANNIGLSTTDATYFAGGVSTNPRLFVTRPDSDQATMLGQFRDAFFHKAVGNRVIFSAHLLSAPLASPAEFWISDGTPEGTHVLNLPVDMIEKSLTVANDGSIMFLRVNSQDQWEIWKTDGTDNGAVLQFAVGDDVRESPATLEVLATDSGKVFFHSSFGTAAGRIWQTDGTLSGTFLLNNSVGLTIRTLKGEFGNGVVFEGINSQYEKGVYFVSDALTEPRDLSPVQQSQLSYGLSRTFVGPRMLFAQVSRSDIGSELWSTDIGSPVTLLKDIAVDDGSSFPGQFIATDAGVAFTFRYRRLSGNYGRIVAVTDGTSVRNNNLRKEISNYVALPNGHLFGIDPSRADDLLTRESGSAEWNRLQNIVPDASVFYSQLLSVSGNRLYYLTGQTAPVLWVTDGTAAGTHAIRGELRLMSDITAFAPFREGGLLFERSRIGGNRELWVTDGTSDGTKFLATLGPLKNNSAAVTSFQSIGGRILVVDEAGNFVITDGSVAGTRSVSELASVFPAGRHTWFGETNGSQYFGVWSVTGSVEFWKTDGSIQGTQRILQIADNSAEYQFSQGVVVNGLVYFVVRHRQATRLGTDDLWVSDGSTSNTRVLKAGLVDRGDFDNIYSGEGKYVQLYSEFGRLFFRADDGIQGQRLWMSDGTPDGTELLASQSGQAPPFMFNQASKFGTDLVGYRGAIYYSGVTDTYAAEPVKLTSDSIDISPALTVDRSGSVPVLRWTEVFGAEAYDIQFIDLNGGNAVPINVSVTADHWVLPAIAENGLYRIWIRGTRASGAAGPWNSDPYDFTLGDLPVIHSVRGLTPGSQPAFDWASPVGTTSTEIWVNDLDSKQRIAYSVVTGARSRFILPGLPASQYVAWVRTSGHYGASEWSQAAVFTVLAPAPQNVVVDVNDQRVMTIDWSVVSGATDYEVLVKRAGSTVPVVSRSQIGPVTTFRLPQPVPGDFYTVWIRARRPGRVYSEWSDVQTVFIKQAPVLILALPNIRWDRIGQAIGYEVSIVDVRSETELVHTQVPNPAYLTNLNPGKYKVQIRTLYRDGQTSAWTVTPFEVFHPVVSIQPQPEPTVDATPVIQWISQAGADNYEFVVIRDGQRAATYRAAGLTNTVHRIATPLPIGNYHIWIRSHYLDGSRSAWGAGTAISIGAAPVVRVSGRVVSWTMTRAATNYDILVQVQNPKTLAWRDVVRSETFTETTLSLAHEAAGQYRVWVRAKRNEAGDVYFSNWSLLNLFKLS